MIGVTKQPLQVVPAGNTAGTLTTVSTGTLFLAGGNNITLSQSGNTISIKGGGGGGSVNFSAGVASGNLDSVVFSNLNGVSFGLNGSTITASAVGGGGAGLGESVGTVAGTDLGLTVNTDGVSILYPKWITTYVNDLTSGRAGVGETVGTIAGTDLAMTVDTAGVSIGYPKWITTYVNDLTSGRAGVGETVGTIAGTDLAMTVDTAGVSIGYPKWITTYVNDLTSGRAGVGETVGTIAGTDLAMTVDTAGVSIGYPKWITTYVNDLTSGRAGVGETVGTIAGTDLAMTVDTDGVNIGYPKWITTYVAQTNQTVGLYASSNTTLTSSGTVDARSLSFRGIGGVTVGYSNGEVLLSGAGGAQTNQTIGIYVSSNTNLTSSGTVDARSMTFRGVGAISLGYSNGELVLNAPAAAGDGINVIRAGTIGTTGTTYSNTSGTILLNGYGALTVSQDGSTNIGFSVPATSSIVGASGLSVSTNGSTISVYMPAMNAYEPIPLLQSGSMTYAPGAGTWYMQPMLLPFPISGGHWNIMVAHGSTASNFRAISGTQYNTTTTGTLSITGSIERRMAFFSVGAGANSTRLESIWQSNWPLSFTLSVHMASAAGPNLTVSQTIQISAIASIDSLGGTTMSTMSTAGNQQTVGGGTLSTGGMTSLQSKMNDWISSHLLIPIPFNTTLTAGQYYVGGMWNSASGSTVTGTNMSSTLVNTISMVNQYGIFGNTLTNARMAFVKTTGSTGGGILFPGVGFFSATSVSAPATMAFSDIRTLASQQFNWYAYVNSVITV